MFLLTLQFIGVSILLALSPTFSGWGIAECLDYQVWDMLARWQKSANH